MKRFDLFTMYNAGKLLGALGAINAETVLQMQTWPLWQARFVLQTLLQSDAPLLSAGRRAASNLIVAINGVLPEDWQQVSGIPANEIMGHRWWPIVSAANEFETVLRNEMPDVAAYVVAQKGIYRTEDLIDNADKQVAVSVVSMIPPQAVLDLKAAGKCLAYELGNACAFHLWRAVESVIGLYHFYLTEKTLKQAKIQRNWGAYLKALTAAGADQKVSVLLLHIKDEFRNPQTHPDASVGTEEAQRLFSVAISAIEQMLFAGYRVQTKRAQTEGLIPPPPVFPMALVGNTFATIEEE